MAEFRKRCLPAGWYPLDKTGIQKAIAEMQAGLKVNKKPLLAGIVPHAGWQFSGRAALQVFLTIAEPPDTFVVCGGHLGLENQILAAYEQAYETPLGLIQADLELLACLKKDLFLQPDSVSDNTVEIQLPFIKYLFPQAKVLWLRVPPSSKAISLGEKLAQAGKSLKKKLIVIGSTDLTHYGLNYGFAPQGSGAKALAWVKDVNDKRLIDLLLSFKLADALEDALKHASACSVGGAVSAASFAFSLRASRASLLAYYTSYDVMPHDSFVGYAAIGYEL